MSLPPEGFIVPASDGSRMPRGRTGRRRATRRRAVPPPRGRRARSFAWLPPLRDGFVPGRLVLDRLASYWQNYQSREWKSDRIPQAGASDFSNDQSRIYDSQAIAGETNGLPSSAWLRQVRRSDASSDLST